MHWLLVERKWYWFNYSYMPEWLIIARYSFSWLQRVVGIIVAIGLFRFKEVFRKLMLLVSWFTILTVYWKHPYTAFKNHTLYLDRLIGPTLKQGALKDLSFSSVTLAAVITACLLDIIFFGVVIYYLTRPKVKAHFSS